MSKPKSLFEIALESGHKCDVCGKELIFMHGGGSDYDMAHCSDRECGAEYQFPTTTEVEQGGVQ